MEAPIEEKSNGEPDKPKPKALVRELTNNELVKSWRTVVQRFCKSTTMHGMSRLVDSTRWTFRLVWLLTVLAFLCILLWQAYLLVDEYRRHPSTTDIQMVTNNKLTFPAVTVCNTNRLRKSRLGGTRFKSLLEYDRQMAFIRLGLDETGMVEGADENSNGKRPKGTSTVPTPSIDREVQLTSTSAVDDVDTTRPTNNTAARLTTSLPLQTSTNPTDASTQDTKVVTVDETGPRQRRGVPSSATMKIPGNLKTSRHTRSSASLPFAIPLVAVPPEKDGSNWGQLLQQSQSGNLEDFIGSVNPSRWELQELGHQAEEFILQCSFNQQPCEYRNFTTSQNTHYGNCFTFNRPVGNISALETGKTGSKYGLHLTLFTDQSEYIGLLSHQSGVRVAIHQPNARPFPEDEGLTASTGTLTSIGLRQRNITRLGGKYSDCRKTVTPAPSEFVDGFDYSMAACLNACYQIKLRYECGCVRDVMGNTTLCSTLDAYQASCQRKVDQMLMDNELGCDCLTPCSEIDYEKFASFSKWPTDSADQHLKKKLHKRNRKAGNMTLDAAFRRKNMVRLEIFYEKLNYESYTQRPKYTFEGLLGGIGGLMGFFAGMSLITVFELCGFIIQSLGLLCGKLTTPEEAEEGGPRETRIGRMGRRLSLAFGHHHGRGGSRHGRQTDL